jgi:hypothetical protein
MNHQLWRLDAAHDQSIDDHRTAEALRSYLAHAGLANVLVRIGQETRAYLALDGCDGCDQGRCLPGCRAELLRRAMRAAGTGDLTLVREGLARRQYTTALPAIPTNRARRLDADILQHWNEARTHPAH